MTFPRGERIVRRRAKVPQPRLIVAFLLSIVGLGCGSVSEQFIGTRIPDVCNGAWSVCSTTVGCILGDTSYVEGRFPGANQFIVKLFEPSTVTVGFLLSETSGAGTQTVINFYEASCSSRVRVPVTGKTFLGESQQLGFVQRSADLTSVGDHLIEVESDARTKYDLKIDVLPLRLQMNATGP
jgi:hypothetical protein